MEISVMGKLLDSKGRSSIGLFSNCGFGSIRQSLSFKSMDFSEFMLDI
jgi:hypothetical protein